MTEKTQTKTAETTEKTQEIDVKELLKAQAEQLEALAKRNNELATELSNLKANTAEENELLGEKIKAIKDGKKDLPEYNPFQESILYKVTNEVAKITTIMTGDEVQGIIGSIDIHIQNKLIKGDKKVEKHPYIIELIPEKTAKKG